MDIKKLKEKCITSAIEYGIAAYEVIENSRKTNRAYDKNRKYFKSLKEHEDGINILFELLEHEHVYVRFNAAIYLLSVDEKKAKEVINEAATFSIHVDNCVFYLLQEWDNGNIKEYYS